MRDAPQQLTHKLGVAGDAGDARLPQVQSGLRYCGNLRRSIEVFSALHLLIIGMIVIIVT